MTKHLLKKLLILTATALASIMSLFVAFRLVSSSVIRTVVSPTPAPLTGKWKLYDDPWQGSGWVSLYSSAHGGGGYAIAKSDGDNLVAAGRYGLMFREAGYQPEWWEVDNTVWRIENNRVGDLPIVAWGVAPIGKKAGWIIGQNGGLVYFNDTGWRQVYGPSQEDLWDIQMIAPNNGWIVGENGTIWHYDGEAWTAETPPTSHTLYAVSMLSPNEGWAVGRDGIILHRTGKTWLQITSPITQHLRGLDMISETEGWAVGADGAIAHYKNNQWQLDPSPVMTNLHAVSMLSPVDGWAVGQRGALLHYDGQRWRFVPQVTQEDLWDVLMLSANEGWAIGARVILHYRDGVWRSISDGEPRLLGYRGDIKAVSFVSSQEGYAAGYGGYFLHYDGSTWHELSKPPGVEDISNIEAIRSNDVWLAGDGLWHFTEEGWLQVSLPKKFKPIADIQMLKADSGWAVGNNGTILQFHDDSWTPVTSPTTARLNALSMLSPEEGWAVGIQGTILHFHDGRWLEETSPTQANLIDIDMLSTDEGWILMGDEWRIGLLHRDKSGGWTEINLNPECANFGTYVTSSSMKAIEMVSPNDGWLVGSYILHYQHGEWNRVTDCLKDRWGPLRDIVMLEATEGWAVGRNGTILHYEQDLK